jgi:TetR/AcrR family transcriptional repressor of mexJK operon
MLLEVAGQLARSAKSTHSDHSGRKRRAIQKAGTATFLRLGYASASMDAIAAEAGVSKQTIYNHFHSKEELFKAIVMDMTASLMSPLSIPAAARSTPGRLLRSFAWDFLTLMLQPSSLALHRLIVAESARFPELGEQLYAVGPGQVLGVLADYLAWETRNGRLAVGEPARAGEQFIGMLGGRVQLRALLGVCETPDKAELDSRVEHAVSSFLTLYARDNVETGKCSARH